MIRKEILVTDIVSFLGDGIIKVEGTPQSIFVDNVADVEHTTESTLDWINASKQNKQELMEKSKARVLLVDPDVEYSDIAQKQGKILLVVGKPRQAMAKVIGEFFVSRPKPFVHPTAVIDEEAVIDPTATISAGCVIGKARIGKNTVLKPNVVVYDDVNIGNNCLIQAGAVIGTDGLGCSREPDGTLIKFPHVGGIIIGDNVEIGANCQIAKGVLSDTRIDDGCKINGLCFIAHNSHLEKNVWITGDTMLCGSTHVGKNTTIYSNVIVREQSQIGERVTIGMGSVVTKPVPNGEVWIGTPAHKLEKK